MGIERTRQPGNAGGRLAGFGYGWMNQKDHG
jgi:hypothetical protein